MKASAILAIVLSILSHAARAKPNIILINADDLGYAGLGCYGQKLIQTPRVDQMAAEGMRFTDFYAASAACVPSRCGLLTGRHPGHAAIRDNFPPHVDITRENGGGFMVRYPEGTWPPKQPTLGRVIKDAGYRTAQFGKLEAGIPMAPGKMTEHGWDHWFGFKGTGAAFQFYPLELWKKRFLYEGGIRVPMIVRWPGRVPAGKTSSLPWAQWDLMPTLAELAGASQPSHTDGISVVPTMMGQTERQVTREYLYWEYQQGKQQAVRMGRWKAVRVGGTMEPIELYDLSTDPGESRDVARDHPETIGNIRRIMEEAREGSEFTEHWKIPERRRPDIKMDQVIYNQIKNTM